MHIILFFIGIILFVGSVPSSDAALVPRLGGQAVYDTDLNITWLADANAGAGSAFDDAGPNDTSTDGRMSWNNAMAWAHSLSIGGFTDWRLPITADPDTSCSNSGLGSTTGRGCIGSEMGHLFHMELGGDPSDTLSPQDGILSSGDPDLALFSNIQSQPGWGGVYWSQTKQNEFNAYSFNFNNGIQDFERFDINARYVWAVRDGDVLSTVPIPSAIWLFGSGLLMLVGFRKHNRNT